MAFIISSFFSPALPSCFLCSLRSGFSLSFPAAALVSPARISFSRVSCPTAQRIGSIVLALTALSEWERSVNQWESIASVISVACETKFLIESIASRSRDGFDCFGSFITPCQALISDARSSAGEELKSGEGETERFRSTEPTASRADKCINSSQNLFITYRIRPNN